MTDKFKKMLIVVFLTLLIWAWAYLAIEEAITKSGTLDISPATSAEILVSFNVDTPVSIRKLKLKGPPAKIGELERKLLADEADQDKERLEFFFDAEKEKKDEPGTYPLDVAGFLNNSSKMRKLGLTIESCDPGTIEVTVEKLVKKRLVVQCIDENGATLDVESVDPAVVEMFVRQDWIGDLLKAYIRLTPSQMERARKAPVKEAPYVELIPGKHRQASLEVAIKMASTEGLLKDKLLQPRLGYIFSRNLKGKYDVEILNETDLTSATNFKSTDDAWTVYESRAYHILVEIRDGDEQQESTTRQVVYNFPSEFVAKNQIKLAGQPREAKFKLIATTVQSPRPSAP